MANTMKGAAAAAAAKARAAKKRAEEKAAQGAGDKSGVSGSTSAVSTYKKSTNATATAATSTPKSFRFDKNGKLISSTTKGDEVKKSILPNELIAWGKAGDKEEKASDGPLAVSPQNKSSYDALFTPEYFSKRYGDLLNTDFSASDTKTKASYMDAMRKVQAGLSYRSDAGKGDEDENSSHDALYGFNSGANDLRQNKWLAQLLGESTEDDVRALIDDWQKKVDDAGEGYYKQYTQQDLDSVKEYARNNFSSFANEAMNETAGKMAQINVEKKRIAQGKYGSDTISAANDALGWINRGMDATDVVARDEKLRDAIGYSELARNYDGYELNRQLTLRIQEVSAGGDSATAINSEEYQKLESEYDALKRQLDEQQARRDKLLTAEQYEHMLGQSWVGRAAGKFNPQDYQYAEEYEVPINSGGTTETRYRYNLPTLGQIMEDPEGVGEQYQQAIGAGAAPGMSETINLAKQMTDEERRLYKAIAQVNGEDEAQKYFDFLKEELTARESQKITAATEEYANEHPILGSAVSVGTNILGNLGITADALAGRAGENQFADITQTTRETIGKNIAEATPWANTGDINWLQFLYNTGMSGADMLAMRGITGAVGGGQGFADLMLGNQAFAQAYADAYERTGGDVGKAWAEALAVGALEAGTEHISWGALEDVGDIATAAGKAKYLGKNFLTEGLEETVSGLGSTAFEWMIEGQDSEIARKYADYTANGYTKGEAIKRIATEFGLDTTLEFLGGGIMGGTLSGANLAIQTTAQNAEYRSLGSQIIEQGNASAVIQAGLKSEDEGIRKVAERLTKKITDAGLPQNIETSAEIKYLEKNLEESNKAYKAASEAFETAKKEQNEERKIKAKQEKEAAETQRRQASIDYHTENRKIEANKAISLKIGRLPGSKKQMGRLYTGVLKALDVEVANKNRGDLSRAIETRMNQLGEKPVRQVTDAIAAAALGEELTQDQKDILEASSVREGILNEIVEGVAGNWASNIAISDETRTAAQNREALLNATRSQVHLRTAENGTQEMRTAAQVERGTETTDAAETFKARGESLGNADAAAAMTSLYSEKQDARAYATSFENAYNFGMVGMDKTRAKQSAMTTGLSNEQFDAAYSAGVAAEAAGLPVRAAKTGGEVRFADGLENRLSGLDGNQRASINALRRIAELGTVNIEFFESEADASGNYSAENGSYDPATNTIRIDINAGRNSVGDTTSFALLRVAGHELTHYIKAQNKSGYNALQSFVVKQLSKDGTNDFDGLVARKMERQPELSYADAVEEVVADGCEMMLKDSTAVQQLAQENKSLFHRIRGWITNWVRSLKRAFQGVSADSETARLLKDAEGMQKLWDDALVQAGRNVREEQTRERKHIGGTPDGVPFEEYVSGNVNVKFSKRTTTDGTQYVYIDDPTALDAYGVAGDSISRKTRLYMRDRFRGIVLPLGKTKGAYVRSEGINEYTNPAAAIGNDEYEFKMRAVTELENLLESSTFVKWNADDGRHKDAVRGWNTWLTRYAVKDPNTNAVRVFEGQVKLKRIARGDVFYDITQIKEITNGIMGQSIISDAQSIGATQIVAQNPSEVKMKTGNEADRLRVLNSRDDVKFSIRKSVDGYKYVDIDTDQAQFDGLTDNEKRKLAENIIRDKFMGKVIGKTNRVFVNGVGADEYARPAKYLKDSTIIDAKMRAAPELDNLMDAGFNFRQKNDDEDGHMHENAVGGFTHFDTIFHVADGYYIGRVNVINGKRGRLFKDVTNIKSISPDHAGSSGQIALADIVKNASRNIIASPSESVKKHSLRTNNRSDREILATAFENVAKTDAEKKFLEEYKSKISDLYQKQAELRKIRQDIAERTAKAERTGTGKNARIVYDDELIRQKNRADMLAKRIDKEDNQLIKMIKSKPLQDVLRRQKASIEKQEAAKRKEAIGKIRERRDATEVRHKIKNLLDDFNRKLKNPTEKSYIPADMVHIVIAAEEMVSTDYGREKSPKVQAKLAEIQGMYARYKNDATFAYAHDQIIEDMLSDLGKAVGNKTIYQLNNAELTAVYDTLKALQKQVSEAVKLKAGDYARDIIEGGREMAQETIAAAPLSKGKAGELLNWQLTPDKFFARLAGYKKNSTWSKVAETFSKGTEKMYEIQRDHYNHFRKWTEAAEFDKLGSRKDKEMVDIGLVDENGEAVKITRGMMLSVYMHLSSEDNARGFMYGGFSVPNMKAYYNGKVGESYGTGSTNSRGTAAVLSEIAEKMQDASLTDEQRTELEMQYKDAIAQGEAQLDTMRRTIEGMMTEYERGLIEAVHEWNDGKSQGYINDVTMDLYGIKKAQVQNYYPIHRDTAFVQTDFASISRNVNLENWGSLKNRVPSQAPILLTDICFEMDNSMKQMSRYVGYARAQRDFGKLYNVRLPGMKGSVKKAVSVKFGTGSRILGVSGEQYIENYIGSITGSRKSEGSLQTAIRRNLPRATMTLNLRVGFSQLSAIPKAAAEVGWGNMTKGFIDGGAKAMFSRKAREELAAENVWFWQRWHGEGGQREFADAKGGSNAIDRAYNAVADSRIGKWLFNWCQNFDVMSTVSMKSMAEAWAQKNTRHAKGSAEYNEAVKKKYTEIVRNTQAMSSVTERSDLARSTREGDFIINMYKSEAFANFNMMYDAIVRLRKYNADLKAGINGVTEADVKAARNRLVNTATSVVIGAGLGNAVLRLAINAVMHAMNEYRNDEDEVTLKSTMTEIANEVAGDVAGMVVFGGDLYEFLSAKITGDTYYGISDSAVSEVSNALEQIGNIGELAFDKESTLEDWKKAAGNLAKSMANMMGLPVNNAKRFVTMVQNHVEDIGNGEFLSFEAGANRSNGTNYGRLVNASLTGDKQKWERAWRELTNNGLEEDKIRQGYRTKLKEAYMDGDVSRDMALQLLEERGGQDADEAYWTMEEWEFTGEGNYSKYTDLRTALKEANSTNAMAAYNELAEHGVKEDTLANELTKVYNSGDATNILNLQMRSDRLFTNQAKPKGAAKDVEADGDAFDGFITAVITGRGISTEIARLMEQGYKTKNFMTALNTAFGDGKNGTKRYRRMEVYNPGEAKVLLNRILDAYEALGLDRNEEIAWINENWTKYEPEEDDE